jgi:hypothetical protein
MMHTCRSNVCADPVCSSATRSPGRCGSDSTVLTRPFVALKDFVDDDRVDVANVLTFLDPGNFLVAENGGVMLGCVYVEPCTVNSDRSAADRAYLV